ncbi:MAG: DUF493 family protein [Rhodothermales bacterium]
MNARREDTGIEGSDAGQFKRLLDEQNDWPAEFIFKFIVPKDQLSALEKILDGYTLSTRQSRNGNYLAITLSPVMNSSDDVIRIYRQASEIKGIVSL